MNFCSLILFCAAFSAENAAAFQSSSRLGMRKSSSLSMSAALIVQNKGGGHGELGKSGDADQETNPLYRLMLLVI